MSDEHIPGAMARDGLEQDAYASDQEIVRAICRTWDLDLAAIGDVTAGGRWRARWNGEVAADVPRDALAAGAAEPGRPMKPRPPAPAPNRLDPARLSAQQDLAGALLRLVGRRASAPQGRPQGSQAPHSSTVRQGEAVRPGGGAAVVRLEPAGPREARRTLAVSLSVKGRWCILDPYLGAQHAVAECARSIACLGGEPLAGTVRLSPGTPGDPEVTRRLAECVRGIGDAARALGAPVVAGDLPLHDAAEGPPSPAATVGMIGLVEPLEPTCSGAFRTAGDVIALVGSLQGEVGGSAYLAVEYGAEAGPLPALDLARERAVQETVRRAVREGLLSSARGCAEGGLAVALAECCLAAGARDGSTPAGIGCAVRVPFPLRKDFVLFGEDASRVVVSLPRESAARFVALAQACGAPVIRLGAVGGDRLVVESALDVPVTDLAQASGREPEASTDPGEAGPNGPGAHGP